MSKQQLKLSAEIQQALTGLSLGRTNAPVATFGPEPIIIAPQKPQAPVVAPR